MARERIGSGIGGVTNLLSPHRPFEDTPRCRDNYFASLVELGKFWRRINFCGKTEPIAVAKEKSPELSLTESGGLFQHGAEYGLQLAGRRTDDAQHL